MALKDKLSSIKNVFLVGDNYEEEYVDEQYEDYNNQAPQNATQPAASPVAPATGRRPSGVGAARPTGMKVIIVEPKVFEDSENIAIQLRDLRPVVINFENTDDIVSARIIDFISGATYALDGRLEKIGTKMFICTPMNIAVDHNEKVYTDLGEKLAWKEPQL